MLQLKNQWNEEEEKAKMKSGKNKILYIPQKKIIQGRARAIVKLALKPRMFGYEKKPGQIEKPVGSYMQFA